MRGIGVLFLVLGVLTIPVALLGIVSGNYHMKGTLDVFIDIVMRLLYVGTPVGLVISGIGLLIRKNWGRYIAVITSIVLFFACFGYGISGLGYKENFIFCLICFISASIFGTVAFYLRTKNVFLTKK